MFKQFVSSFSTLPYDEVMAKVKEEDIEEFRKMNNRQRSGHGFLIDLIQNQQITSKDLHSISCPVLIMHSKHDGAVPVEHAYEAHDKIPRSDLYVREAWGHLIWLGEEAEEFNEK